MEILKELGHGMFGTVYKVRKDNNYYAMKLEHILESDKIKSLKSPQWREIEFAEKMNKLYPDQFIKLYSYEFEDDCDHVQKYTIDLSEIPRYWKKRIDQLAKSKLCIKKVYELVDGSLRDIINDLDTKQKYSMMIQVASIIKILEKNKYLHGDFHIGNIGYIETDKKIINIFGKKIPTYGFIYKAIDYGSVINPKYNLTKTEKKDFKQRFGTEIMSIIQTVMINKEKFFDYAYDNKIKLNYKKDLSKIMKSDFVNILKDYTKNKDFMFNLFEIIYPDQFQKIILGNKFRQTIPIILYFDPVDYIYIFNNNLNVDKIIDYYYKLLDY